MSRDAEFVKLIDDASEKLFTSIVTPTELRAAESGEGFSDLWAKIEASGFLDALLTEDVDQNTRSASAFVIIRNAGRALVPAPIGETIVSRWLMAEAGLEPPPGPIILAPTASVTRAPYGRYAKSAVFIHSGALNLIPVELTQSDVNIAGEPRDDMAHVGQSKTSPTSAYDLKALGALVRSAQMAGAVERALMLSVDYARTRKQFGKPIGQFQAIQQSLAILAGHSAAASMAANYAYSCIGKMNFVSAAAAAKIRTGEAAGVACSIAHQTFGAIGIAKEHELHFTTRRLLSWRTEYGAEGEWAEWLGLWASANGSANFWDALTAPA